MASNESDNNNNMIQISDDQLSQFMAFSGSSDPSVARQYLEMSGNNLETAVSLFMDHGAGGGGGGGGMGGMGGAGGGFGGGATGSGMGGPPMGATGMGMGGGGDYDVRAPDATRTMRLLGGDSPNPRGNRGNAGGMGGGMGGMGGMGMGGNEPSAALIAAMGGPAAREMMRNMMAAENGMDDGVGVGMGNTWAAAGLNNNLGPNDFRNPSNRSSSRHDRSGSGGSGDGGNARRSSNRRTNNNDNVNANGNESDDDDDDDVQVVDADGQAMDEDDEEEYNYASSDDDDSHDLGGSTNARGGNANNNNNATPPSLSTMFAQPTHLMHRAGGFMGAKNFAKDARRWLLVNIQSDNDFACHALNRDVWRDELVENLVREGFILWQAMSHSNEGQTYIQRYKVHGYPHLAIIDPRTGSLLWRKEGWTQVNPLTADQFVEIASDFCSRHSFDKLPTAARHAYTNGIPLGGAGANESSSSKSNNKRPITELTEEEQLQAAIRASMQEDAGDNNDNGDKDVQVLDGDDDDDGDDVKPSADDNNNDDESKPSAFEQEILTMEVGGEPSGGSVARVQIRMPDGKRLVRKFAGDSPVKIIYAFVAQNNEEAKGGRAFELKAKFPPQDLLSHAEETVMGFGLNGEAINVIWN